jgi:hypothetical protein
MSNPVPEAGNPAAAATAATAPPPTVLFPQEGDTFPNRKCFINAVKEFCLDRGIAVFKGMPNFTQHPPEILEEQKKRTKFKTMFCQNQVCAAIVQCKSIKGSDGMRFHGTVMVTRSSPCCCVKALVTSINKGAPEYGALMMQATHETLQDNDDTDAFTLAKGSIFQYTFKTYLECFLSLNTYRVSIKQPCLSLDPKQQFRASKTVILCKSTTCNGRCKGRAVINNGK